MGMHYTGRNMVFRLWDFFFGARPKVSLGIEIGFRVISVILLIFAGQQLLKLVNVAGFTAFLKTFYAGLTLQTGNLAFYNGTVAVVFGLLCLYAFFSAFTFKASLYLCDLTVLYTLIFLVLQIKQFPILVTPLAALFAIWTIHRVILGSFILYRKKVAQTSDKSSKGALGHAPSTQTAKEN
jgi:hypothetical protein